MTDMDCMTIYYWIMGTICVLGLVGNSIAYSTFGKMCHRNSSNMLLRALAFVDSFLLLIWSLSVAVPMMISNLWFYYVTLWFIIAPFYSIALTTTKWMPLLVGIHRYIVICKPFMASRICTAGNAKKHLVGVFLFSITVNFPDFFRYELQEVVSNNTENNITYRAHLTNMGSSLWYTIAYERVFRTAVVNYAIPVASLLVITVQLIRTLYTARLQRLELSEGERQDRSDGRTEWMVTVVLIVFLVCHTSLLMTLILDTLNALEIQGPYCTSWYFILYTCSHCLILFNSSINCVIYVTFNRKFRSMLCMQPRCFKIRVNQQQ